MIEGFESPYGMELLATIHWVVTHQDVETVAQAVEKIHHWSIRKRMFTVYQIQAAWNRLYNLGWFDGLPHPDGHLGARV